MFSIAARIRPSLAGALLLTAIACVPWAEHHQQRGIGPLAADIVWATDTVRAPRADLAFETPPSEGSDSIVLTPWDRVQLAPQHFDVLVPPKHPDAQPWPRGMVIGLNTPSVDPGIQQWFGSPLANVMSAFLAPWAALAHQLGA
ncbi:MAG TPA: hypothetical protein VMZ53_10815 [Kofleriaceae bacterium]|nr:hypothetical protein [Kofleriaceae bacterium]